jgi:enoyl-[acyl-carrier-protein] reductase (NADH)
MPADFLQLAGKRILVMGVANRKSVAGHISRVMF